MIKRPLQNISAEAGATARSLRNFIAELKDGVTVKIVRKGEGTIMDFVMGNIDELPVKLIIEIEES